MVPKYTKPELKNGDRIRNLKNDIPFRKGYKPSFTDEIFEILAKSACKPPTYIIKDPKVETLGIFF